MARLRHALKGKLIQCARCNSVLFLELLNTTDMDGGYSTVENYEPLPSNWLYDSCIGYLCPSCSEVFEETLGHFFFGRDNIPKSWKTENDPTCVGNGVTFYKIVHTEVAEE